MTMYNFRLRFKIAESYRVKCDLESVQLIGSSKPERIRLVSGEKGSPINEGIDLAIIGGPYSSDNKASIAAFKSKRALLHWALISRTGIYFGDGKHRSGLTKAGLEWANEKYGCHIPNDMLGIDIYEHSEIIRFASIKVKPTVDRAISHLVDTFKNEYYSDRDSIEKPTDKLTLASEIYSSSFFDTFPRSRFVTLITAIEALIEEPSHSEDIQRLVDEWIKVAQTRILDSDTRNSIVGRLRDLNRQSIGQSGAELVDRLLSGHTFDNKPAVDFFKYCYDKRSQILHEGKLTDNGVDLWKLANSTEEFVHRLILASFNASS